MPASKVRKDANGNPVKFTPESGYSFTHKGKKYVMPTASDALELVDNDVWMDAYLNQNDEVANMRLIYEAYKADTGISDEVRSVLKKMEPSEFIEHITSWFASLDENGVSAGESSSSEEH